MNRHTIYKSVSVLLMTFCIASSAWADLFWKWRADYEVRVYDSQTRQPIEGVYVLAAYLESGSFLLGHSANWCVSTAGAYTDKQGRATFPRSAKRRPHFHYIKPGYAYDAQAIVEEDRRYGREPGANPEIIYLIKQNANNPQRTEYVECDRAKTRKDVEANIEYLRLLAEEDRLYRPGWSSESIDKALNEFKSLPDN